MTDQIERLQDPETIRLHMGELTASEMRVAQAAIRYALAGVQGGGSVTIPRELYDFLIGAEPLRGLWFGDKDRDLRSYWWRNDLRAALPQPPKENGE